MSLQKTPPTRVFVELVPWADRSQENNLVSGGEKLPGLRHPLSSTQAQTATREVHVSGTSEVSAGPDRAQVVVRVSSTKEAAAEAKKSVCRRLDYITQSLQQQGVQAENITVTKDFRRVENAYHMEAEVCITFTEFGKMQNICNFLVEKLDSSVVISPPQFYHTPGSVENLRRQACLVAVENAWRKAQEVCNLVGQTLGKPLLIKEEETKEWEGQIDDHQSSRLSSSLTVQQKIKSATIHAASKVFITFEVLTQNSILRNGPGKEQSRSCLLATPSNMCKKVKSVEGYLTSNSFFTRTRDHFSKMQTTTPTLTTSQHE
ncbi:interleukin-1 receptor-associated kinase 1-binding protein 1 isoform X1 [Symphalangus syndactylus]|uniref:interleukin-1 receptor-associated kinase 1-binding protein 1 isoform X1 n=1 Tax=Symphalangus syndactylus TaxID=9590 RepID=UPI00244188D0|nr:interleukin-1 receptor-associated kinase 1-binding protein 1 isoform X1 [Symphalangus syndactylus]